MMEHIFRNINDIRLFDMMTDFVVKNENEANESEVVDIDEIMNILEYPEYKRLEVEDSVNHLVRNEILGIKKITIEGKNGCKICKWTDKFKIPRIGEHIDHIPEQSNNGEIENYYMKSNSLTKLLISAVFQHVFMTIEQEENIKIDEKDIVKS